MPGDTSLYHRPAGSDKGAAFRRTCCTRDRRMAGLAGIYQHGCEYGGAADKGIDVASDELWRQQPRRQLYYASRAAAYRLGKPAADERLCVMKSAENRISGYRT